MKGSIQKTFQYEHSNVSDFSANNSTFDDGKQSGERQRKRWRFERERVCVMCECVCGRERGNREGRESERV